jgi:hypothetical protein
MSGGSMNYMYQAGLGKFVDCVEEGHLADCIDILEEADAPSDFMEYFQQKVEQLAESINFIEGLQEEFAPILKACEWKKSGDWGDESILSAVQKHVYTRPHRHVDDVDDKTIYKIDHEWRGVYQLHRNSDLIDRAKLVKEGDHLLLMVGSVEHHYVIEEATLIAAQRSPQGSRTYQVKLKEHKT